MRELTIKDTELGLTAEVDVDGGLATQLRLYDTDGDVLITVAAGNGSGITTAHLLHAQALTTGVIDPGKPEPAWTSPPEPKSMRTASLATVTPARRPVRAGVKPAKKTTQRGRGARPMPGQKRPPNDELATALRALTGAGAVADLDLAKGLADQYKATGITVPGARGWVRHARAHDLI